MDPFDEPGEFISQNWFAGPYSFQLNEASLLSFSGTLSSRQQTSEYEVCQCDNNIPLKLNNDATYRQISKVIRSSRTFSHSKKELMVVNPIVDRDFLYSPILSPEMQN